MEKVRTEKDRADLWRELESPLCDVAEMAEVCWILVERYQDEARGLEADPCFSKEACLQLLQQAAKPLVFSVYHLDHMIRMLKAEYYGSPPEKAAL